MALTFSVWDSLASFLAPVGKHGNNHETGLSMSIPSIA